MDQVNFKIQYLYFLHSTGWDKLSRSEQLKKIAYQDKTQWVSSLFFLFMFIYYLLLLSLFMYYFLHYSYIMKQQWSFNIECIISKINNKIINQ